MKNEKKNAVILFKDLIEEIMEFHIMFTWQECKKCIYTDKLQHYGAEEKTLNVAAASDYLGKVCQFLIRLMTTQPSSSMESIRPQSGKRELLEEIDLFSKCLMRDD